MYKKITNCRAAHSVKTETRKKIFYLADERIHEQITRDAIYMYEKKLPVITKSNRSCTRASNHDVQ